MGKVKIQKNRSIDEMFDGVTENKSFETMMWDEEPTHQFKQKRQVSSKGKTASDFRVEFFTEDLQEKVGKILLDIKMAYFKDGVGDISLEVVKDGRNVVIKTAPKKVKTHLE